MAEGLGSGIGLLPLRLVEAVPPSQLLEAVLEIQLGRLDPFGRFYPVGFVLEQR